MFNTFLIPNKIYIWRNPPWCFNNYCMDSSYAPPLLNTLPARLGRAQGILEIDEMRTEVIAHQHQHQPPGETLHF